MGKTCNSLAQEMFCFDGKEKIKSHVRLLYFQSVYLLMAILTSYCFQGLTENDRKANITYIAPKPWANCQNVKRVLGQ